MIIELATNEFFGSRMSKIINFPPNECSFNFTFIYFQLGWLSQGLLEFILVVLGSAANCLEVEKNAKKVQIRQHKWTFLSNLLFFCSH